MLVGFFVYINFLIDFFSLYIYYLAGYLVIRSAGYLVSGKLLVGYLAAGYPAKSVSGTTLSVSEKDIYLRM